jgi:hypothetical protein
MANSLDMQIAQEGPRNAIVKLTGVLDTSDISETPAIALQAFTNNADRNVLAGFRVDLIEYSISQGLEVILEWEALNPEIIYPVAGRGRINSTNYGGFVPRQGNAGYSGNINLRTSGWSSVTSGIATFVVILELIKLYK